MTLPTSGETDQTRRIRRTGGGSFPNSLAACDAMLHLRRCVLTRLLSSPATSISSLHRLLSSPATSISPFHRLLSAVAPDVSPSPGFAAEEYLVDTCGLTRAQALKASPKLSHLKSPSKPDAVLAYLAGLGLSGADIAAVVAKDPLFLCTGVDRTLRPNVVELSGLGLSHAEIACLVSLSPICFRCKSTVSNLPYYLSLLGSNENLLRLIKKNSTILLRNLEKTVKPNYAFLQECGLGACDIAKLWLSVPWIVGSKPELVQAMAARAEAVGVPRGSGMFRLALQAVASLSEEKITVQVKFLKNIFRWSDAEVGIAVCKFPVMLTLSKDTLQSKSEFLISEMGLEPTYIAHRPVMLGLSLEGRLRPRCYVVKFLKENGLIDRDMSYYSSLMPANKVFVEKYIHPYKETAPRLAEDYAAACRGEMPTRFRFT